MFFYLLALIKNESDERRPGFLLDDTQHHTSEPLPGLDNPRLKDEFEMMSPEMQQYVRDMLGQDKKRTAASGGSGQYSCHSTPAEVVKGSPEGGSRSNSQDESTSATTLVHPLMIPQFNYWPYLHPIMMVNQFIPFPFGPQPHFPYFPYPFQIPAAPWYYFQQPMMNTPVHVQPMTTASPSVAPHGESLIAQGQSVNTGSGTSITNIVMHNEIGNEKGNDNSTNVKIRKNGTPLTC
jgi:hypothetical protein